MNAKKIQDKNNLQADQKSSDFLKRFVDFKNGYELFQPVTNVNNTDNN